MFRTKFLLNNYSGGNDLGTIKVFDQKIFRSKYLKDNYSRGNDFASIKNFHRKNVLVEISSG
jgi:hypothetical protein